MNAHTSADVFRVGGSASASPSSREVPGSRQSRGNRRGERSCTPRPKTLRELHLSIVFTITSLAFATTTVNRKLSDRLRM